MAYITNQKEFLSEIINNILPVSESLKILVGFFYYSGFEEIYKAVENKELKILVGLDIEVDMMNRVKEIEVLNQQNKLSRSIVRDKYLNSLKNVINETDLFDSQKKQEALDKVFKDEEARLKKKSKPAKPTPTVEKKTESGEAQASLFWYGNNYKVSKKARRNTQKTEATIIS